MWRSVKSGRICCCLGDREGKKDVMKACVCVCVCVCVGGCDWRSEVFLSIRYTYEFFYEVRRGAVSSVRIPLVFARGVPSGGSVWNLCVNDTTFFLVVGMVLSVGINIYIYIYLAVKTQHNFIMH